MVIAAVQADWAAPVGIVSAIVVWAVAVRHLSEIAAAVSAVAPAGSMAARPDKAVVAAPRAWAAAVLVAVVAAVAAVVVAVAAVGAEDAGKRTSERRTKMKQTTSKQNRRDLAFAFTTLAILCGLTLALAPVINAQKTSAPAVERGKAFDTPQAAADALIAATEQYNDAALTEILGPDSYDIIHTGEPARDKENSQTFAAQARGKMSLDTNNTKTRATLIVGEEDWPFPLPIVKVGTKWYFDTRAGRQELLFRRVGRNELDAISICRGYVEAQNEYAVSKKVDGVNQYAQRIISTPGQQDGLAWQNADGSWDGPIGEKVAAAIARGYASREEPYHGYFFKVLKGQGPAAPLGELDYVIKGKMIGGFALLASPAQYRNTGVKSFMVSQDGVVWEKDLGPKTLETFKTMDRFNPDRTWAPVKEN